MGKNFIKRDERKLLLGKVGACCQTKITPFNPQKYRMICRGRLKIKKWSHLFLVIFFIFEEKLFVII